MNGPNAMPPGGGGQQEDEINLGEYLAILIDSRWLIGTMAGVVMALGIAYALVATPIFRSDVLIQVEAKGQGGLTDLEAMFTGETPAEAEIEILRSRSLVGSVVDALHLDITVEPRRFPVIGAAIARRFKGRGEEVRDAVLGMRSYAWGGERLSLSRLEVPRDLEERPLTLVAGTEGSFKLLDEDGRLLMEGKAGQAATGGEVSAFVSELVAQPGTEFLVTKARRSDTIADLQKGLRIAEKGKKTGILQVALEGPFPAQLTATLDSIAKMYLRQNVERKSQEAEKTLEFLNAQLPDLKTQLQEAEAALNDYRSKKGSVDLTLEASAALDQMVEVEKRVSDLQVQRADLRRRFTDSHPVLASTDRQMRQLEESKATLNDRLKALPESELQSARLMRDVKVNNELYVYLLNKAQELRIVKSGTIGNVRILDEALHPYEPIRPRKSLIALGSLFAGLLLGAAFAVVRRSILGGVEDPEVLERLTGLSVYASILHSGQHEQRERGYKTAKSKTLPILAATESNDIVVESIRSLRTSLQFAALDAKNNIIAVGGPSPGIGKSFVSVNLAYVLADGGKSVLLIDGDMRKGKLNRYFAASRAPGLSEVIREPTKLDEAIRSTENKNLSFLASGEFPPNPSELLLSDRFEQILKTLSTRFDLVVIDTPPILAVTDGAILGRKAGLNLMVLRSGQHPAREIATAVRSLDQNGTRLNGIVLNDVKPQTGLRAYSRYAYHYRYDYK